MGLLDRTNRLFDEIFSTKVEDPKEIVKISLHTSEGAMNEDELWKSTNTENTAGPYTKSMITDIELDSGRGARVDEGRIGDWMQTYTGRRFYPADPRSIDVDILDIAVALGNMTRYNGHCQFYSVAEHSVLVCRMVEERFKRYGLMHDAAEAYLCDVTRPVKRILGRDNEYFALSKKVDVAIGLKFGLIGDMPKEVIEADAAICIVEREALHSRADVWDIPFERPKGVKISCLTPIDATIAFLTTYGRLFEIDMADEFERLAQLYADDFEAFEKYQASHV